MQETARAKPGLSVLWIASLENPTESLSKAIRIPGQVVVDHQVGTLEVDALTGGISGGIRHFGIPGHGPMQSDNFPLVLDRQLGQPFSLFAAYLLMEGFGDFFI